MKFNPYNAPDSHNSKDELESTEGNVGLIENNEDKKREQEPYRVAGSGDTKVSMEIKVLRPVREAAKKMAAYKKLSVQEYVEHLLVESLNKNTEAIDRGQELLEQFNGNTLAIKRFAEKLELERFRKQQQAAAAKMDTREPYNL